VAGDVIGILMNGEVNAKPLVYSGHTDTVHPKGLFPAPVVRREGDRMYGPGTLDCKGGVVAALMAMDALKRLGYKKRPLALWIMPDEETSSIQSGKATINYIVERAKDAVAFLNLEGGSYGKALVARKGILRYELTVHGVAGHSSQCPDYANAVTEAAHKIIELEKLKDIKGLTCNCGVIHGGTVGNSVAAECKFIADIRFATLAEKDEAVAIVKRVAETVHIPRCTCEIREVSYRPPMEATEKNYALLDKINKISAEVGLPHMEPKQGLGGSDAAYSTIAGIPTLDSIGYTGKDCHSVKEYVEMSSILLAAKYFAATAEYIED
jgi:glutamate carboxypeptidase